jgi:hypothetical protein
MREVGRLLASSSLLLLVACEGRGTLDSPLVVTAPPSGGGADDAGGTPQAPVEKPPEKQIAAADGGTAIAPMPASCTELAAGGTSDDVDGFMWQVMVADGQGSDAYDFVELGYSCGLKYQHANQPKAVTLDAADCAAAHGWATNTRFLQILRTGDGCAISPQMLGKNATEMFEVDIHGAGSVARKTYQCPEPTLDIERGCFRALVDRLFP